MKSMHIFLAGLMACGLCTGAMAQEEAPAPAEQAVTAAPTEADLVAILQGEADWNAKTEACRVLKQIGTAASVPALAALLNDDALSHYARYALEVIPGPEATKALIAALANVNDTHKAGIAATLGVRRDEAAIPPLADLLPVENDAVSAAAAAALGRIGTYRAAKALLAYVPSVPEARRVAVGEALLAAAQTIGREGEARHVATITKPLSGEGWPGHIRLGAFETQAIATPALAHTALIKALGGDDAKLRDTAAALVAELQKSKTSHYLRALPKLPAGGQAALLKALGMRGDPEAEGALIASLESDTPEVREAAMQALGDLDTPGAIPVLAKLLAPAGTPESAMAREALRVSRAKGADDILSRQLLRSEGELKVQLLELLTDRLASQAVVLGARVLENEQDPALRLAAWRAMAQLGGEKELRVVLAALPEDAQGDESAAAAKALASVAAHHPDAALPLLVEALKGATPQRMPVLMRTLPRIGTPGALEQVLAALNNEDAAVQTEAIAALEDWPSGDALPHLLALAQSEDAARHERGLRGYVRIARTEQDPNKRGELLDAVMPLARKKEEKWAVLAAYGTVMHPRAFDALQAQLGDAEVRNEAGAAITTVARELGKKADFRARAVEALEAVIAHCDQQGVKDRAAQARDTLAAQ